MSLKLFYIILAVALDGAAGLVGGLIPIEYIHRHLTSILALAAGTLVGVAFVDLIPEALHHIENGIEIVPVVILSGFTLFYIIENLLGSHAAGQSGHKHNSIGPLILIGDALHNTADGMAIAAAFLLDVKTGVATTIAVIIHELPQEISDYSILVAHGYSKKKALFSLFMVQLSALIGALITVFAIEVTHTSIGLICAFSAGGFIYIAAADLLPELQNHKGDSKPYGRIIMFIVGILIISLLDFHA